MISAMIGTTRRGQSLRRTLSNTRRAHDRPTASRSPEASTEGKDPGRRPTTFHPPEEVSRSRWAEMAIVTAATTARVSARKSAARRRHASPRGRRTCAHSTIERRSRSGRSWRRQREGAPRSRVTPATVE